MNALGASSTVDFSFEQYDQSIFFDFDYSRSQYISSVSLQDKVDLTYKQEYKPKIEALAA